MALLGWLLPALIAADGAFSLLYVEPRWQGVLLGLFNLAFGLALAVMLGHWLGTNRARIRELEYWAGVREED